MQKILDFKRKGINYHVYQFNGSSRGSTIKNVGAYETIEHAVRQGANVVVDITSGNYGDALKQAALQYNNRKPLEERVKVVHIIGPNDKVEFGLRGYEDQFEYSLPCVFPDMKTIWLTPQDRTEIAREFVEKRSQGNFQVGGVFDATHFIPNEYLRQAEEILQQKVDGRYLDYLAIPVGTGRAFISFYTALNNLRAKGVNITTQIIGFVPEGENPIYNTFVIERPRGETIEHIIKGFSPISKADKLSCPDTDLRQRLLEAIYNGHKIIQLTDEDIGKANLYSFRAGRKYRTNLELEDSGSIGFALADDKILQKSGIKKGSSIGIFVTGMGLYASPSWEVEKIRDELRQRLWKETREKARNLALYTSLFAGGLAGLIGVDYAAKQLSPAYARFREYTEEAYNVHQQKTEAIKNIIQIDNSMLEAMNQIEKKYRNTLYGLNYTDFPESVIDEIILRYLELNKEKIAKIEDPRDAEKFNRLRYLVWLSSERETESVK